jgi:predicted peptidase
MSNRIRSHENIRPCTLLSLWLPLTVGLALLITACGSNHSFSEENFPTRVVTVGNSTYRFRLYIPPKQDPEKKLPVMLYLHGSNRRGEDNSEQLRDIGDLVIQDPSRFNFIIVFPQCRPEMYWAGPMMKQALAALDQTVKEFNGDEHRLYLAGYSMGGFGTWQVAITHPDKFTALVPVAGGIEPMGKVSDEDRALLSPEVMAAASSPDPFRAFAEALRAMPVWIVHGNKDDAVPVEQSRKIAEALRSAGDADVNYVELDGVDHASVKPAFSDPKLFQWLEKHSTK